MKCAKVIVILMLVVLLSENAVRAQNNSTNQKPVRPTRRPGFFRSLYSLIFDTKNDAQRAYNQISKILSDSFQPPSTTTLKPAISLELMNNEIGGMTSSTPVPPSSTTRKLQISLTREEFNKLARRNLLGLAKVFNTEWKNAMKESQNTIRETGKEFRKSLEPFVNS